MFEMEKSIRQSRVLYFKTVSTPTRCHQGGYSATTTRINTLFLFYHGNQKRAVRISLQKNEVDQSLTSFLYKTTEKAVPCSTLVILRMQTIGLIFENKQVLFCQTKLQVFELQINKNIINMVAYLFLPTKFINRGLQYFPLSATFNFRV